MNAGEATGCPMAAGTREGWASKPVGLCRWAADRSCYGPTNQLHGGRSHPTHASHKPGTGKELQVVQVDDRPAAHTIGFTKLHLRGKAPHRGCHRSDNHRMQ